MNSKLVLSTGFVKKTLTAYMYLLVVGMTSIILDKQAVPTVLRATLAKTGQDKSKSLVIAVFDAVKLLH
jgi:hypothetical protein